MYEVREARGALEERGVREETVTELMAAVEETAPELLREYEVEDEVDDGEVTKWLKIGFCETCVQFIDEGVWESAQDGVDQLVEDMEQNAVSNATTVAGGLWRRSADMMQLSGAMLADNYWTRMK